MTHERNIQSVEVIGYDVQVDHQLGHLWVAHDNGLSWDDLQTIKNLVWGPEVRAIEVYPAASELVHAKNMRHLWRLGPYEFCPDLLGRDRSEDSLQSRYATAWSEAHGQ